MSALARSTWPLEFSARLRLDGVEPDHAGERAPPNLVVEDRLDREAAARVAREQDGAEGRQSRRLADLLERRERVLARIEVPDRAVVAARTALGQHEHELRAAGGDELLLDPVLVGGEVARRRAAVALVLAVQVDEHVDLGRRAGSRGRAARARGGRPAGRRPGSGARPRRPSLRGFGRGRGLVGPADAALEPPLPREPAARRPVPAGAEPVEPDGDGVGRAADRRGRRVGRGGALLGRTGRLLHRPIMAPRGEPVGQPIGRDDRAGRSGRSRRRRPPAASISSRCAAWRCAVSWISKKCSRFSRIVITEALVGEARRASPVSVPRAPQVAHSTSRPRRTTTSRWQSGQSPGSPPYSASSKRRPICSADVAAELRGARERGVVEHDRARRAGALETGSGRRPRSASRTSACAARGA